MIIGIDKRSVRVTFNSAVPLFGNGPLSDKARIRGNKDEKETGTWLKGTTEEEEAEEGREERSSA